jgi:hypothetical protein
MVTISKGAFCEGRLASVPVLGEGGWGTYDRLSVLVSLVLSKGILRDLDVLHHAFGRLGERRTRLDLELGEHVPLRVVRYRSLRDETLGEVRVVVALESILLDEEAEEGNRLVEDDVDFCLGFLLARRQYHTGMRGANGTHALESLLEVLVDKERDVLGRLDVLVDKLGKGLRNVSISDDIHERRQNTLTSFMDFSNALSAANALVKMVSNLSFKSRTFCTHASAALVLAPVVSTGAFFAKGAPSTALPLPLGSGASSSTTTINPSLTCFPTRMIHADMPACSAV